MTNFQTERSLYPNIKLELEKGLSNNYRIITEATLGNGLFPDILVLKNKYPIAIIEVKKHTKDIDQDQIKKYQEYFPTFIIVDKYYLKNNKLLSLKYLINDIEKLEFNKINLNIFAKISSNIGKEIKSYINNLKNKNDIINSIKQVFKELRIEFSGNDETLLNETIQLLILKPFIYSIVKENVLDKKYIIFNLLYNLILSIFNTYPSLTKQIKLFNEITIDSKELSKKELIHFYELFLTEYDSNLKQLLGTYYTKPELVNKILNFLDDKFQEYFNIGLSDTNINILDPALGTGIFLDKIIDKYGNTVSNISRLYGFEINSVSYIISQILFSKYQTSPNIYLTNSLESSNSQNIIFQPYNDEVNNIKKNKQFKLILGNPPYRQIKEKISADKWLIKKVKEIRKAKSAPNLLHYFIINYIEKIKPYKDDAVISFLIDDGIIFNDSEYNFFKYLSDNFDIYIIKDLNKYFNVKVNISLLSLFPKKENKILISNDFNNQWKEFKLVKKEFPLHFGLEKQRYRKNKYRVSDNLFILNKEGIAEEEPFIKGYLLKEGNNKRSIIKKELEHFKYLDWKLVLTHKFPKTPTIFFNPSSSSNQKPQSLITNEIFNNLKQQNIDPIELYYKWAATMFFKVIKKQIYSTSDIRDIQNNDTIDKIVDLLKQYIPKLKNPTPLALEIDNNNPDITLGGTGYRINSKIRNVPYSTKDKAYKAIIHNSKYWQQPETENEIKEVISMLEKWSGYVLVFNELMEEIRKII